jgi:hypothetical protein
VRIDHVNGNKGDAFLYTNNSGSATGPVYGVIDHSYFQNYGRVEFANDRRSTDGSYACPTGSNGGASWHEFLGHESSYVGTGNALIWEDDHFTWNSAPATYGQGAFYSQYGGRVTVRYSTWDSWSPQVTNEGDNPACGSIYYELYNNTIATGCTLPGYGCEGKILDMRSGNLIVHDNTFTSASDVPVMLIDYPNGSGTHVTGHDINNSFFWNNTWNGSACQTDSNPSGAVCVVVDGSSQSPVPTRNTNFYLRAPNTGDVYAGYTPYTYPHPLVSQGGGTQPTQNVSSIALTPTSASLLAGGSSQSVTATCNDQNGLAMTCPTLSWSSSASTVATVAAGTCSGSTCAATVTPNNTGTSNVTASSSSPAVSSSNAVITVGATPSGATIVGPGGTTYTDCSASTINSAILAAADGATILLTCTGNVNWSSTGSHSWSTGDMSTTQYAVNIPATKGITLQVQGADNTNKSSPTFPLTITVPSNVQAIVANIGPNNSPTRISGFKFQNSGTVDGYIAIIGAGTGKNALGGYRVDNNYFNGVSVWNGVIGIWAGKGGTTGNLFGLVDNNTFYNIYNASNPTYGPYVIQVWNWWHPSSPSGNTCWGCDGWTNNDFVYGGGNQNFMEDNLFQQDASASGHIRHYISSELGGRYVSRHNTFVNNYGDTNADLHDAHGTCALDSNGIGSRGGEIYSNTIQGTGYDRATQLRGGSWLIYDNVITAGGGNALELNEYRSSSSASQCTPASAFPSCPTANTLLIPWPVPTGASWTASAPWCSDVSSDTAKPGTDHPLPGQIFNTYVWNNLTPTGSLINPVVPSDKAQTNYIILNSDYFASSTKPAGMTNYTPYAYPHPLRTGGTTTAPAPPTGLKGTVR